MLSAYWSPGSAFFVFGAVVVGRRRDKGGAGRIEFSIATLRVNVKPFPPLPIEKLHSAL